MRIKNFLFHRVTDEKDKNWPPIIPALFERILRIIKSRYSIIALEEFLASPGDFDLSKNEFATISFDDGYKDNIEYAAPILKQLEIKASFYVVTDCIDRNLPTWTFLVDHAVRNTKKKMIEFQYDFVPAQFRKIPLRGNTPPGLKPLMKNLDNSKREKIVEDLLAQCNDVELPYGKMMSWKDINELKQDGFVIGSHTHTHPMLAALATEEEIENEMRISYQRILKETGIAPQTLSYPIGSYDERVKRIAKSTGYKYGLAVEQQFWESPFHDVFQIPRVELYNQSMWLQRLRINGIYLTLRKIIK